jgi:hypothetical protein
MVKVQRAAVSYSKQLIRGHDAFPCALTSEGHFNQLAAPRCIAVSTSLRYAWDETLAVGEESSVALVSNSAKPKAMAEASDRGTHLPRECLITIKAPTCFAPAVMVDNGACVRIVTEAIRDGQYDRKCTKCQSMRL